MRESVLAKRTPTRVELTARDADGFGSLQDAISHRGLLVWSEHCTECAYPTCYGTCSLYAPRADNTHCRRFEKGIEDVRVSHALQTRLMQVVPRQWAKLEAQGPTAPYHTYAVRGIEQLDAAVEHACRWFPIPYRLKLRAVQSWNFYKNAFSQTSDMRRFDAFVIECILLSGETSVGVSGETSVGATLTFTPRGERRQELYQSGFVLEPGYCRFVISMQEISKNIDLTKPFFVHIEPTTPAIGRRLIFGLVDFVTFHDHARASLMPPVMQVTDQPAQTAKCIIWDLDNTVWAGTLGEDGAEELKINPKVIQAIKALDARGILHSIASKNDETEALVALEQFGLKDYFLYPQIGWAPKSESVRRVAESLDIGLDSLVFIDDQAFERAEVSETLGVVRVFPETVIEGLCDHPLFNVPVTAESRTRRLMYRRKCAGGKPSTQLAVPIMRGSCDRARSSSTSKRSITPRSTASMNYHKGRTSSTSLLLGSTVSMFLKWR